MGILRGYVGIILSVLFLSLAAPIHGQQLFFQPPSYGGTGAAVTADFNRDGKPDIVSADGTVALGNGDGTFTYPATLSGVSGLSPIATADFNGDGKPDLVLGFNVYLGKGDGTFQPPVTMGPGANAIGVAVADVNGDGKPDALILIAGGGVLVFLGKGDGTFTSTSILYGSSFGTLLGVGDFNGDGKADIVLANDSGSGGAPAPVEVLLGNGDGTFRAAISSTAISRPQGMVAKDVNGDGRPDLVITTFDQTFVLLGDGDGTFQAPGAPLPAAGLVAVADVNGDGKPDVIVSQTFTQIFLGNGDGTFALRGSVFGAAPISGISMASLVVADFSGDGKPDIAAANAVLFGNGDGTFQGSPVLSLNQDRGALGSGSAAGDFNGDGSLDLAIPSATTENLYILLNDGTGNFTIAHTYPLGFVVQSIAAADVNKDGKLDLLLTVATAIAGGVNFDLDIMLGNGDGTFAAPSTVIHGIPTQISEAGIADFNGDRVPDLAFVTSQGLEVFVGKGDGTFALPVVYFLAGALGGVSVADYNNDGNPDVSLLSSGGFTVLLGKGDGTFQSPVVSTGVGGAPAGDLNGDGKVDLVNSAVDINAIGWDLYVSLGNGDGTFRALTPVPIPKFTGLLPAGDINGDGKADLVEANGLEVLLGNGDGTFGTPNVVIPGCAMCLGPSPIFIGDVNGDHRPDVVLAAGSFDAKEAGLITMLNVSGPAKPDFGISVAAISPETIAAGGSITTTVTSTPVNGFTGAVVLSCIGLPTGANCGFTPSSVSNGSGTSLLKITSSVTTPTGVYFVSVIGTSANLTHARQITVTITAPPPDFSLAPASTPTATVTAGQTATYMLSLGAAGGFSGNVALTCNGAPTTATCSVSPAMVSVGGATAATATVSVATTASSELPLPVGDHSPREFPGRPTALLAALMAMLIWICTTRKNERLRWAPVLTMVLVAVLGITLTSCGGGSSGGGSGTVPTGTQAGTYTITVSATATGSTNLTHAAKLTLVVR